MDKGLMKPLGVAAVLVLLAVGCEGIEGDKQGEALAAPGPTQEAAPVEASIPPTAPEPALTAPTPPTTPEPEAPSAEVPTPPVSPSEPEISAAAPAPAPQPQPTPMPAVARRLPPGTRTYTVVEGDTPWSIAVEMYGEGKHYAWIEKANPDVDTSRMQAGQVLLIPAIPESRNNGATTD
jgi:nucleoid-associated protein YgaU